MCRTSFIKKLFAITLELLIFFPEHLFTESVIQMANNEKYKMQLMSLVKKNKKPPVKIPKLLFLILWI